MTAYRLWESCWGHLVVDKDRVVVHCNEEAAKILNGIRGIKGKQVGDVLPWLRENWFGCQAVHKVVKTSPVEKLLFDMLPDQNRAEWFHVFLRQADKYSDLDHLWCEVADSVIGVQKFIDTSYDGMLVADGGGTVLAVNNAFVHISGIHRQLIIGKHFQQLVDHGLIPFSCTLMAIRKKESVSAVVKYPQGKEAIVTSTPLMDKKGKIVRVLSNVRDITELKTLHEQLKSVKALASGFQRELKAIQATSHDVNINMVRSRIMDSLYSLVTKVAATDLQLLITGESGVGKTALAKFVHQLSDRSSTGNFIHVNCSAIPESLLESELFGFEEGSFTGAKRPKVGLFELADRGTLFLDEIGDMPLPLQAKLLNILQEGKFYRVGGTKEITVDVRIIAATNMQLEQLIACGRFRQDLFFRLNVVPIRIPSLRERRDDIPPLIAHYLKVSNSRYKRNKVLSPGLIALLLEYEWPGNIRELINLIERLVVVVDEQTIELRHLPADIVDLFAARHDNLPPALTVKQRVWRPATQLKHIVEKIEADIIDEAVSHCGSLKEASRQLGVNVTTLIRKRKRGGQITPAN